MAELQVFDKDPNIYLFTSLTAGSSHIITATSRIETILKANKIPFIGLDTATHELGKKLFQRRAAGKKLPLLVKEGYVLGGIEEIEEWNEYDELHEALGVDTAFTANPPKPTSLFEPAPSKTPPPLAGALPGGFSFGDSVGSAFGSLGSIGGGSKAKENKPVASAEQNLAIRQMGAEAAKIAASKKPAPVKISTTNPLLTEKTNAKSPADVLSPKSTPLPKSPNTATTEKSEGEAKKTEQPDILSPRSIPLPQTPAAVPKLEQKPVHAPPKIRDDAENPALSAGPVKTTQAKKESSEEEEEDSEEEETSGDSTPAKQAEQTQEQDPKDASKAGASVKEGEQEEEESSEEESEDSAKAAAVEEKMESKAAEAKGAAQPKQSSSEETSEEEEEDDDDDDEEESKEEEKKQDTEKDETKKAPNTDAKDASKAGESVLD